MLKESINRTVITLVPYADVDSDMKRVIESSEMLVEKIITLLTPEDEVSRMRCMFADVAGWFPWAECLEHPLSSFAEQLSPFYSPRAATTVQEFKCYLANRARFLDSSESGDFDMFVREVMNIGKAISGSMEGFRTSSVGLEPDMNGTKVSFPHERNIPTVMRNLSDFLVVPAPPSYKAMVTMASILNAHPFQDGNGRVSRISFNIILWGRRSSAFLPMYDLKNVSRFGFELRLREAELHAHWLPIAVYLKDCLRALHERLSVSLGCQRDVVARFDNLLARGLA